MNALEYVLLHLDGIASVVAAVIVAALAVLYIRKNGVAFIEAMLLCLVTQAEKDFGGGTGVLKKSTVVTAVYERLPSALRLFISEKTISDMIDSAVTDAKVKWKNNIRMAEIIGSVAIEEADVEAAAVELKSIIERLTSDEGKAVTMDVLKSIAELCGIDTTEFKKKADAVSALKRYAEVA